MCIDVKNEIPKHYCPEVKFNLTVIFQPKPTDHILEDAEQSVSSYTNTSIGSKSWASVVSESETRTSQTINTITPTTDLANQMAQLTKSISIICDRLDKLEK